jgi:hypothetical protein
MDPETKYDQIADFGIKDGMITAKDSKVLKGVYPGKPVRMPVQH